MRGVSFLALGLTCNNSSCEFIGSQHVFLKGCEGVSSFENIFNHFDAMVNKIIIFGAYPINLPKGSLSVSRLVMSRCVV